MHEVTTNYIIFILTIIEVILNNIIVVQYTSSLDKLIWDKYLFNQQV